MKNHKVNLSSWLIVLVAVTILSGCDRKPSRVPVSGQALLDGKPLGYGQIVFIPVGGRQSTGEIDSRRKVPAYMLGTQ